MERKKEGKEPRERGEKGPDGREGRIRGKRGGEIKEGGRWGERKEGLPKVKGYSDRTVSTCARKRFAV